MEEKQLLNAYGAWVRVGMETLKSHFEPLDKAGIAAIMSDVRTGQLHKMVRPIYPPPAHAHAHAHTPHRGNNHHTAPALVFGMRWYDGLEFPGARRRPPSSERWLRSGEGWCSRPC